MSADRTFITNENGRTLKGRFEDLIKGAHLFDCLAGYFYTSGFFSIYQALEGTEKIPHQLNRHRLRNWNFKSTG